MKQIEIGGRPIGKGFGVYTIAEIGSNHNLDKKVVRQLIDEASVAGFDAVKFQTYEPLEVFSEKITTDDVNYEHLYGSKPWWEVARDRILMPREWFGEMFEYARSINLMVFSTVHSVKDAEFIMQFDPPAFKVASIDVSYLDFLAGLAKFDKPIILSTGMSYIDEIREAVDTIINNGNDKLILLHCISCYPPEAEMINLLNIVTLEQTFDIPVGFSDHSPENHFSTASVALGACVIEKHITLDRNMEGPDHIFALDPKSMREFVSSVRQVEKGMGASERVLSESELESRKQIRRSVVARESFSKGEVIKRSNLKLARPGTGIEPKDVENVAGKRAKVDVDKGDVLTWEMVD